MQETDRVRPSSLLPAPGRWYLDRPAEQLDLQPPSGPRFGSTGPDLGYGLGLARRFKGRLQLEPGESENDAVAGCFGCGSKRAARFGRAPVIYDMEWAYSLWGFLGGAPAELVTWRRGLFRGAAHDYWDQREIVDAVKVETFGLNPAQVRERLTNWKELLIV
jgi:hypothetical protein